MSRQDGSKWRFSWRRNRVQRPPLLGSTFPLDEESQRPEGDDPAMSPDGRFDPRFLPELVAMQRTNAHDVAPSDYISMFGPAAAIVLAELFWPRWIEIQGCVLFADRYHPDNFQAWWTSLEGDIPRIESMINHTHLEDIWPRRLYEEFDPATAQGLRSLAQILAQSWAAALRSA